MNPWDWTGCLYNYRPQTFGAQTSVEMLAIVDAAWSRFWEGGPWGRPET